MPVPLINKATEIKKVTKVFRAALGEYREIVAHHFDGPYKFMLYQVNDFYVELKYITEGNVFKELNTFKTTERLELYLKQINIDDLR